MRLSRAYFARHKPFVAREGCLTRRYSRQAARSAGSGRRSRLVRLAADLHRQERDDQPMVMTRHCAVVGCLLGLSVGWSPEVASAQTSTGPSVVSLSPGAGAGAGRTFTFAYSNPDGASSIAT